MQIDLNRPCLTLDLGAPHRVISWAVHRPGLVQASRIVWREVRDTDLPPGLDVEAWLAGDLDARGLGDAVVMLTARDIGRHHLAQAQVGAVTVQAVATAGLMNAERIGARVPVLGASWGTINIALRVDAPLTDAALIEAVSMTASARTLAVMDHGPRLTIGQATGTGTDCIAVACPLGDAPLPHAGMHTDLGEAIGRAALDAISAATVEWMRDRP